MFTFPVLSYLCALWLLMRSAHGRDREVVDTLAVVWLCCTIVQMLNNWDAPLPVFLFIDFFGGIWMSAGIRSRNARRVAIIFLPMMCLNAGIYARGEPFPLWHYPALAVLSWVQLAVTAWGIRGDGIRKYMDHTRRRIALSFSFGRDRPGGGA